jgi:plastocyanin
MKQRTIIMIVCCSVVLFAACGNVVTSNDPNTVVANNNSFSKGNITIQQGQTFKFQDAASTHILVIGQNGNPDSEAGAADFGGTGGHHIEKGDMWITPPWNTPGTYHVTCTIHPGMNLTVTVTAPNS